jgi:recombinational DNA repair protein RecR
VQDDLLSFFKHVPTTSHREAEKFAFTLQVL